MERHTLDATGKKIGRLATEAAQLLMGKHDASYERHVSAPTEVHVINAGKLHVPERKRTAKTYVRHSGYPSGLARENLTSLIRRHGHREAVRRAVYGMLPSNKLRARAMKRLVIDE